MNKKILSVILGVVMIFSQMSFVLAEEPSKENALGPVISLDTSQLEHDKYEDEHEGDFYILDQKIKPIAGTIETNLEITKLQYRIDVGKWNLITEDLIPSKKFTIEKLPMIDDANILTIIATDSENNTGTYSIEIYNLLEENSEGLVIDEGDSDGDGLLNFVELYYGTDLNKVDTDGDGLTDYEELEITDTDPLKVDTDDNGILDGDEDFDEDGLTNKEEIRLNGEPYYEDTDWDHLTDGQEVELGTRLDEQDTDDDGLMDGQEVELGTNPLVSDTDGNGTLDGDEKYTITLVHEDDGYDECDGCDEDNQDTESDSVIVPKLSIEVIGREIYYYEIDTVWGSHFFLAKYIPGYIGQAYEFNGLEGFENALISFEYAGAVPISEKFKPSIYYMNYDRELLEKVSNQSRNGKTMTAKISQLGQYIVLNEVIFDAIGDNK